MSTINELKQALADKGVVFAPSATKGALEELLANHDTTKVDNGDPEPTLPITPPVVESEEEPEEEVTGTDVQLGARKYAKKQRSPEYVPLALCNRFSRMVALGFKQQKAQAMVEQARAIVKAADTVTEE